MINDLIPDLISRNLDRVKFKPENIYNSLLKETDISSKNVNLITNNTIRFLIVNNLKLVTPPLIREITNVELLKLGLEKERLQNTRIGLPYYDLKTIKESKMSEYKKNEFILEWINREFKDVFMLIKKKEDNK